MFDVSQMQKMQAQMQERLENMQEEMKDKKIEGVAGGGAMKIVVDGNQEILSCEIKKGIIDIDDEDLEMLQDLFIAAANQAIEESKKLMRDKLSPMLGGMKIPGLTI